MKLERAVGRIGMKLETAVDRIQPPGLEATVRRRMRKQVRDASRVAGVRLPAVLFCIGLVGAVVLLVALAYVAGRTWDRSSTDLGTAVAVTVSHPAVALGLGAVLVLFGGWCFRRVRFERLVRTPGPMLVRDLHVPPEIPDVDAAQLSNAFRRRLMQLRLQAPTPVPGATPAQNFLEMLDAEHLDAKNPLGSVIGFLRAAIPSHGYEVSAALLTTASPGADGLRFGVAAQVTRLPHEAVPVETAWGSSWEAAVTRAADIVTAAVLPRTKLSNRPPWSGWRRYMMPALLVHHFEQAEELTRQRRYDEALNRYFRALELDPKNVDLRLHKGFVQEKLALFLDALATYAAARRIAGETSRDLYRLGARRRRKASGRIACYRLAVLLGGRDFARQWRNPHTTTLRGKQRDQLRDRLKPELIELLEEHELIVDEGNGLAGRPPWSTSDVERLLDGRKGRRDDDEDECYLELRRVLAYLAKRVLERVLFKVRRPWTSRTWLSPLTVRLTSAWLDLRLDWAEHRLEVLADETRDAWCPHPEKLLRRTSWRSRVRLSEPPFRTATERYNAACLFAIPLQVEHLAKDEATRSALVNTAVAHLAKAMSGATSQYVADRRDWVLSEDPDLVGLRATKEFKHFETMYFPSATRTPKRPANARLWEQSHYTNDLLAEAAKRWEAVWHRRREEVLAAIDPHVVLGWCADEERAWSLIAKLTRQYKHWWVRYELIEQMDRWGANYGFEPLRVCVKRFESVDGAEDASSDQELSDDKARREIERKARHEIDANRDRLREIAAKIPGTNGQKPQLKLLQSEIRDRDFWHRPTPWLYLPYVCDVHAAMWQRLHEWVEKTPKTPYQSDGPSARAFADAVEQAGNLSNTYRARWVREVVHRRFHRFNGSPATGAPEAVEAT
jgi:hypothetical protein